MTGPPKSSFDKAFARLLLIEGTFSDDPDDPGGATKWGITEQLARAYGYAGRMQDMAKAQARALYEAHFWVGMQLPQVLELAGEGLAERLFDAGVSCGRARGGEMLQRALNELGGQDGARLYHEVLEDGSIGPVTLDALRQYVRHHGGDGISVITRAVNCLQGAFYLELGRRNRVQRKYTFGRFKQRIS